MSFILPLAIIGGSGISFVARYIYNSETIENKTNNIAENDLIKLKKIHSIKKYIKS